MIDIHCHLLPGIDDGASDLEEAAAMARLAADDGVTDIIVTPHQRHYHWPNEDLRALEALFADLAGRVGTPPRLALGAEIRIDSELLDELHGPDPCTVLPLAGSRYLLLEFDIFPVGPEPEDVVRELRLAGWRPVLAHPERLPWLAEKGERLAGLVEQGALLQLTAMSVTGDFGRRAQACCRWLIDHDLAHFVASDAHDPIRRPPLLSHARARIAETWGEGTAERLTVANPAAILADRDFAADAARREAAR